MEGSRRGGGGARRGPGGARGRAAIAALAAAFLVGCQTFRPVERGGPDVGSTVRLELAAPDRPSDATGGPSWRRAADGRRLVGEVLAADADSVWLRVTGQVGRVGTESRFDTLAVPRGAIARVERQQLSALKSAALAGGLVAGTFLLLEVSDATGGQAPQPGNGTGQEHRGLLIRIFP